ncbi:MAG: hypothetical protein Q9201_003228 [Fulgogasparrea decipioides]
MFPYSLYLFFFLVSWVVSIPSPSLPTTLHRRNYQYKLPNGYNVERISSAGELEQDQVYGAILVAMFSLAYEEPRNLTKPVSYTYPAITLNITGADEDSQYYRQFASYTLYHALEILVSSNNFSVSNFTLQNKAGGIACKVVLAPPSAEWQQLIGGSSGGLSPRSPRHPLPAFLETRQAAQLYNESAALEKLIPYYASDWYGPESDPVDFFMALATIIVRVSDVSNKDTTINWQTVEEDGYHLNVTNVPLQSQKYYLTNRGVLNICAHAYGEMTGRLGYGTKPMTNFETYLLWTNGTEVIQQHVFRYEGVVSKR